MVRLPVAGVAALLLLACDERVTEPPGGTHDVGPTGPTHPAHPPGFADVFVASPDPKTFELLDERALLVRLSLDLRGVRPTPAEMARVEDSGGAEAIDAMIEDFLASAEFESRVRDLFSNVFRSRVEDFPVGAVALGLEEESEPKLFAAIGEEVLHLVARVAAEDRPWTDLVTADWTMANALLADVYGLERSAGPDERWTEARYVDGRPSAGILSTNGMWWRYLSDGVSYGRGRANAVARIFLCADFLDRPVDFPRDIDLTDEEGIRSAVRENTGCIGCHAGLDPLASYLAGFQYTDKTAAEMLTYHPERERQWIGTTELAPAFYGRPGYSLRDLGRQIAADPRFVQCAVETTWELLLRRPIDYANSHEVNAFTLYREAFLAGGLTFKSLVRAIVKDTYYRMAERPDGSGAEKLVTPEQWGDMLEAWTGYRFTSGGGDVLATDLTGLRSLAGGGDGRSGSGPASLPTATMALVWARTAEAAASFAVEQAFAPPDARALFVIDLDAEPEADSAIEDPRFRAQVVELHRRLFGTRVDERGLEVRATLDLWDRLATIEGSRGAWAGVLTALLRDPALVFY